MYLLDTNVISETRRVHLGKSNRGVTDWVNQTLASDMYTSVVVMMELERGILAMERKDAIQGAVLKHWFDNQVKKAFAGRILSIDKQTAALCAKLHIPNNAPENDAWIAATALQYKLVLVTRNVKDFDSTKVKLLNPFGD